MSSRRTARGLRRFVGSASSAFTCCCQPQGRERIPSMNEEEEFATVLPSRELEWDSTSHVFRLRSRDSYVPPVLPKESSVIPSIDDFRLLKTVGRGAFGKVRDAVAFQPLPPNSSEVFLLYLSPTLSRSLSFPLSDRLSRW